MDCCNYEYRAGGGYAPPPWEGYAPCAPLPYAPYAHYYAPHAHAHDPYMRYYRYDYPAHHAHHTDHALPMDYGAYASKEARVRRALARRDVRTVPAQHLPLPPTHSSRCPKESNEGQHIGVYNKLTTYMGHIRIKHESDFLCELCGYMFVSKKGIDVHKKKKHRLADKMPPLECGMNNRGSSYCEPQMWSHYPMGVMGGGWNGSNAGGAWAARPCAREHPRYPADCRPIKGPQLHPQNQMCAPDGRSTPYPVYEEPQYGNGAKHSPAAPARPAAPPADPPRTRERFNAEPRRSPSQEARPPVVPLPAFQQAFGSTEIGKFAEAFSRTEIALEDVSDNFSYESFPEWEQPEPQWSSQPAPREIKCEDNF